MDQKTRRTVLAVGLLLGTVFAIGGAALSGVFVSDGYHASEGVTYNSTDGVAVTLGQNRTVANGTPFPDSQTVELGNATFSSTGDTHVRIQSLSGDYVAFDQINGTAAPVRLNVDGFQPVEVGGEINYVEYRNVDVSGSADGNRDLTYRGTDGTTTTITLEGLPADQKVRAVDTNTGTVLDIAKTDANGVATFDSLPNSEHNVDVQTKEGGEPILENGAPDDTEIDSRETNLSVDVSDGDYPNDTVAVDVYLDGSQVHSESISSNQTVETTVSNLSSGSHNWSVVAEDEYGDQTTANYTFDVPDKLYIRNESAPGQLIDNQTVTVEFYVDGGDRVITRNTTNGTINLTGLPVNEDYVIIARSDGYYDRHIVIQSLAEQQDIYLLNKSVDSVEVRFTLTDNTGRFNEETTRLYVQKPITRDGSTTYQTVAADEFGVNGFTTILENEQRYRLIVENDQGDRRVLSSYTASTSETVDLTIGDVEIQLGDVESYNWTARQFDPDGSNETIQFIYRDSERLTDSVRVRVFEYGNESNVIVDDTHTGEFGNLSVTYELTKEQANKTWVVEFVADRDGEEITGRQVVGGRNAAIGDLDPIWKHTMSVILLFVVGGLFGGVRAEMGAIVVSLLSGTLWYIQWLPPSVGGGVIALALGISILYRVKISRGAPA